MGGGAEYPAGGETLTTWLSAIALESGRHCRFGFLECGKVLPLWVFWILRFFSLEQQLGICGSAGRLLSGLPI